MTTKQKIFSVYFFIALLYTFYGWLFGSTKYASFFYNLGRGVVWPVHMFPVLGSIITAAIILALVAFAVFSGKNNND